MHTKSPVQIEFLLLMAALQCLMALYVDTMLPSIHQIGTDLDALDNNRYQFVISSVMLGMGLGQFFYGPLADAWGRKPAVHLGFALMIMGTLISLFAQSFEVMLAGRVLQGLGAAGPRVICMAIVRDKHVGPDMARIMSLIMTIFIFSPVVAPMLGQLVLLFAGWRAIFGMLIVLSSATWIWFALRQEETLDPANRAPLSFVPVLKAMRQVITTRVGLIYTLAAGLIHGSLIGFLLSIQGVLHGIYETGAMFPVYFAMMALGVGFSSFMNSKLVYRFDLRKLVMTVMAFSATVSLLEAFFVGVVGIEVSLFGFIGMMIVTTFCFGLLFGNLNALSMAPFGKIAGVASGTIGALTMMMGVLVGTFIGLSFNGTILPMLIGFGVASSLALLLVVLFSETRVKKATVVG